MPAEEEPTYVLPKTLRRILRAPVTVPRRAMQEMPRWLALMGRRRHCVACGSLSRHFLPYRNGERTLSDFLHRAGYVTGSLNECSCPVCGTGDRERHLIFYFDALGLWDVLAGKDILHFAPEPVLRHRLHALSTKYLAADLLPTDSAIVALDVTRIDAGDATFDAVICNHVLEHVDDPRQALSEIRRVLRPGGIAILQTPYAARLKNTFTDPAITSPADRLYYYGQEDHLRLFGTDLFELIESSGLSLRLARHEDVLPDLDAAREGVDPLEDLLLALRET